MYSISFILQLYIHRSGRTARASREGLSVVFVGPEELGSYKKIMKTLNGGISLMKSARLFYFQSNLSTSPTLEQNGVTIIREDCNSIVTPDCFHLKCRLCSCAKKTNQITCHIATQIYTNVHVRKPSNRPSSPTYVFFLLEVSKM